MLNRSFPFFSAFGANILAALTMPEPSPPMPDANFHSPPFGKSKMTVARDARRSRRRKAKKRARRLGHA